jgi:hypothetical protein
MQFSSSIRKVLMAAALTLIPASSFAGVLISVNIAPPVLPVYTQPLCPGEGYIWTPGYWAWGSEGYYWVPGVWVQPPAVGMLWTPGYWGWTNGAYIFHGGYWGPHIGFYGGVNYGFGYTGVGYEGGRWDHGVFAYNRSVNNINIVNVHNVYTKTVIVNNYNRVSFNGGTGGIRAQESVQERAAFHEQHFQPTANQFNHEQAMRADRGQLASVNGGRPHTMAMPTVNERRENQQQRIGNGINNGQMTAGEAARAENRQQQINQQVHADRAANNGHLTQQEHQQVNREQNHASQQIHNEKHNDEKAPH